MPAFSRKLRWLVGVALTPALFAQPRREREEPILRGLTDFHHTEWGGLGAVFDIKQSPEGYLWLTTSKGVLRFDGERFQSLEEIARGAVYDGDIDSIFLARSGGLWLTTQGAGITTLEAAPLSESAILDVLGIAAGVLLLAGLWTPVSGWLLAGLELWKLISQQPADPWADILLGAIGAALGLLGPGSWSVDARLFGWKRINVRGRES